MKIGKEEDRGHRNGMNKRMRMKMRMEEKRMEMRRGQGM